MRKITVNANHVASAPIGLTRGVRLPLREHLRTCGEMDIAPDTVPCNGTTTTAEAFIRGVQLVTLDQDRYGSRAPGRRRTWTCDGWRGCGASAICARYDQMMTSPATQRAMLQAK